MTGEASDVPALQTILVWALAAHMHKQEGHSGPESLTCTMCTSLVQWKVMI